jgi:hypothetical protein
MKICAWEPSRSVRADGRTERHDKANNRSKQIANAPEKALNIAEGKSKVVSAHVFKECRERRGEDPRPRKEVDAGRQIYIAADLRRGK